MVLQLRVEGRMVALVLPLVEGEELGQAVEWGAGMCQKANGTVIGYALGFQEHAPDVPGLLRQPAPPVQQLKG